MTRRVWRRSRKIESQPEVVDVIKRFFGGNLDFPKIKILKKVSSDA